MAIKLRFTAGGGFMYLTINMTTVGKNGNNRVRSDVQLAQFFLKQFYQRHEYVRQVSGITGIKIDGISGPKT